RNRLVVHRLVEHQHDLDQRFGKQSEKYIQELLPGKWDVWYDADANEPYLAAWHHSWFWLKNSRASDYYVCLQATDFSIDGLGSRKTRIGIEWSPLVDCKRINKLKLGTAEVKIRA